MQRSIYDISEIPKLPGNYTLPTVPNPPLRAPKVGKEQFGDYVSGFEEFYAAEEAYVADESYATQDNIDLNLAYALGFY